MKRQTYLSMKPLEEARAMFFSAVGMDRRTQPETIRTEDSLGRVTAEPVFARISSPSYHASAMDGIAVKAETTYGATERNPKVLTVGRDAVWVNTGEPLPEMFDSVIMVEKVHVIDDEHLEINASSYPWNNVRKVGEDIVATEMILPQNHPLSPYDMGALVAAGVYDVKVWRKPRVAIIPSGSELVSYCDVRQGMHLKKGQIIEFNSVMISGLVSDAGGIPVVHDIVPDIVDEIRKTVSSVCESDADVVIINAGSSAGSKDYTMHVIKDLGSLIVHGVAMMPGKPTVLGMVKGKPVIGLPGYPVSASISFENFVTPLLCSLQGLTPPERERIKVKPTRDIPSKLGLEEFLRVNIGKVEDHYVATPLARAAGSITTMTRAEGIIRVPMLSEGICRDDEVDAELLVSRKELENTLVVIGSHDITIDILADEIRSQGNNIRVSSANVGSLGGIMAIRKRTCHMAGSHLLDPSTGEYNVSYIKRYIKGMKVCLFHLVFRDQGLIVQKGNPKGINAIEDLQREDVSFINRQAGSGTRVLLDYKLEQAGISSDSIRGYDCEEFTHMAVAVGVLTGSFDCGMGIYAAAKALDLDFVPVVREQYDLIVPSSIINEPLIQAALETIRSEEFKNRIKALGGYDPSLSGELWKEL